MNGNSWLIRIHPKTPNLYKAEHKPLLRSETDSSTAAKLALFQSMICRRHRVATRAVQCIVSPSLWSPMAHFLPQSLPYLFLPLLIMTISLLNLKKATSTQEKRYISNLHARLATVATAMFSSNDELQKEWSQSAVKPLKKSMRDQMVIGWTIGWVIVWSPEICKRPEGASRIFLWAEISLLLKEKCWLWGI